jgi:hypothetical protein
VSVERGDEQPRDPIVDLQYGDADQARAGANALIDARMQQHAEQQEITRCQRFLRQFGEQNPDISQNQAAIDEVTRLTDEIITADLKALGGYTPEQLAQSTADQRARAHLQHRVAGHAVKSATEFVEEAASRYRGGRPGSSSDGRSNTSAAMASRINATRNLKGSTPLDASFPQGVPVVADPGTQRLSSIVQNMQAARALTRQSPRSVDLTRPAKAS